MVPKKIKKPLVVVQTSLHASPNTISPVEKPVELPETLPINADRVNNILHKERALHEAGVTRIKTYRVIKELLEAVKIIKAYDERGMESSTSEPDLDKRKMGAELALKAFGDLKEMTKIEGNVVHNKVVYQWLSAPNAGVVATRV